MKKMLFTLMMMLASAFVFSQVEKDVLIKWAPGSLTTGKITLGTEFNFKKKQSVEFFIGIPAAVTHSIDFDNTPSDLKSKALSIFAGYRYYLGKQSLRGLYLEPYAKYVKHEASGILSGELQEQNASFQTSTTYSGIGVGAQLGVQFLIAKRVSIDFFFLGPEANSSNFKLTSVDVASEIPWSYVQAEEAANDIEDAIKDIPIVGDKTEVTVYKDQKRVDASYNGFLPGFRFGLSVGVRL